MAAYRIFLAGATGAIGRRLIPLLLQAGHSVVGTTRAPTKAEELKAAGVEPVVVDVYDAVALTRAVSAARPEIVIHQLTDLPKDLNPEAMVEGRIRNTRIRKEGTRNLVSAALQAGARRFISQSIAWIYAPGPEPHCESDPITDQSGAMVLEELTLHSPPLEGVVLRYGQLYGPGTHTATPLGGLIPVHVDAAAYAALLAIDHGKPGIYNVARANSYASTIRAIRDLGWTADFRIGA